MTTIGQRIKSRREELGYSQEELAIKLGYKSRTSINKIELNQRSLTQPKIKAIADALSTTPAYIMGWEEEKALQATPTQVSTYPYIPESVAAGLPTNINAMTTLPYISVPDVLMGRYAGAKGIIFMRVNGESMNKVIPNQAYIAIDTRITLHDLKDGNIVVFVDEFDGYSVKRFFRMQNRLVFRPESDNHDYFDLAFKETDNIRIVGRVVTYIVNLE